MGIIKLDTYTRNLAIQRTAEKHFFLVVFLGYIFLCIWLIKQFQSYFEIEQTYHC